METNEKSNPALTDEMVNAGVAELRKHLEIEEPMDSGFDRALCIDIWISMSHARKVDSSPVPGQVLR